jgi:hypothetical protein
MTRVQPGITLPEKLWEKAKEQYSSRKTSKKIEELIAEDLEDSDYNKTQKLLELNDLSEKRRNLVIKLFEKNSFPYSKAQVGNIARKEGIYTSSQYVKKAVKVFDRDDDIPIKADGGKVRSSDVTCECGARTHFEALNSNDWQCPNCEVFELEVC